VRRGLATVCHLVLEINATIRAQHGGPPSASKPSERRRLSGCERPATRHSGVRCSRTRERRPGEACRGCALPGAAFSPRSMGATGLPLTTTLAITTECVFVVCALTARRQASSASGKRLLQAQQRRSLPWRAEGCPAFCQAHALSQEFFPIVNTQFINITLLQADAMGKRTCMCGVLHAAKQAQPHGFALSGSTHMQMQPWTLCTTR
jgi:hypothetical protein